MSSGGVVALDVAVEKVEDTDKKKKKKHRSKHNSVNEVRVESSNGLKSGDKTKNLTESISCQSSSKQGSDMTLNVQTPDTASGIAFGSMPVMHVDEQIDSGCGDSAVGVGELTFSKSCPVQIPYGESFKLSIESFGRKKIFAPYWRKEAVHEALEKGDAFKALFRVNAHNLLEVLLSDARVLGLGPRFMSLYIQKLAIERQIYYDDVEGLTVEWLEYTSTLVLNLSGHKRMFKRGDLGYYMAFGNLAWVVNPCDISVETFSVDDSDATCKGDNGVASAYSELMSKSWVEPGTFPLTVRLLSTIPVAVYAIGGEDGSPEIGVRLYMSSY